MKNQVSSIKKKLIKAIRKEVLARNKTETITAIAAKAKTNQPFMSNFLNNNQKGFKTVAIQKLISMANALGLKIEVKVKKK